MNSRRKKIAAGVLIALALVSLSIFLFKAHGYQQIDVDGVTRQYLIHVPKNYQSGTPIPLVFGLHGAFGDAQQFRSSSGFDEDSRDFIIPTPSQSVNVIHIHGFKDEIVLYNGGSAYKRNFLSVNESIGFLLETNNCTDSCRIPQKTISESGTIISERYFQSTTNSTIELITVTNQGHSWSGLNREIKKEHFRSTSLAELIWLQLSQFQRN